MNNDDYEKHFKNIQALAAYNLPNLSKEVYAKSARIVASEWGNLTEQQHADILIQAKTLKTFTGDGNIYDAGLALEAPYAEYLRNAMHREEEALVASVAHLSNAQIHKDFDRLWMLQTQGIELTEEDQVLFDGVSAHVYSERAKAESAVREQAFIKEQEDAQAAKKAEAEQKLKNDNFGSVQSVSAKELSYFTPDERQDHINKYIEMATAHSVPVNSMKAHTDKLYAGLYPMGIADFTVNFPEEE